MGAPGAWLGRARTPRSRHRAPTCGSAGAGFIIIHRASLHPDPKPTHVPTRPRPGNVRPSRKEARRPRGAIEDGRSTSKNDNGDNGFVPITVIAVPPGRNRYRFSTRYRWRSPVAGNTRRAGGPTEDEAQGEGAARGPGLDSAPWLSQRWTGPGRGPFLAAPPSLQRKHSRPSAPWRTTQIAKLIIMTSFLS